jgi:DNA-binding NarL/FixJ family response regulator/PAS domain-containing protein
MSIERELLSITETLFEAAGGGVPWRDLGPRVARLADATSATLMVGDFAAGLDAARSIQVLCGADLPPEATASYLNHYHRHDLWTRQATAFALRAPADAPLRMFANNETLVRDTDYLRSEFYNDFGRHYGLRYPAGTVIRAGEAGLIAFAVQRPAGARPFDSHQRAMLGTLLPHLRSAILLRHRLSGAEARLGYAALDGLPQPVLVLDAALRVIFANGAAEAAAAMASPSFRLAAARPAGAPAGAGGIVMLPARAEQGRALAALVAATAQGGPGGALRLSDEAGVPAHAAIIAPLPGRYAGQGAAGFARVPGRALLTLRPLPGIAPPSAALLRDLFGLTRAEAEVARLLAGGTSKHAVAAARGLKETTVRTQVRAILDKTGAANLRALEQMLAGLQGV